MRLQKAPFGAATPSRTAFRPSSRLRVAHAKSAGPSGGVSASHGGDGGGKVPPVTFTDNGDDDAPERHPLKKGRFNFDKLASHLVSVGTIVGVPYAFYAAMSQLATKQDLQEVKADLKEVKADLKGELKKVKYTSWVTLGLLVLFKMVK